MTAKIFLTGASGYLGGEVLYQLSQLPTKHHIRCLVRTDDKAAAIQKAIPTIGICKGDLDDVNLIEAEAREADVVFHLASTKHEASSRAVVAGLSDRSRKTPGVWLQMGGGSMFAGDQTKAQAFGEAWDKIYDDLADIDKIRKVIEQSPARVVDNLVVKQDSKAVRTALVAGPIIYGKGRGAVNTNTIQGPAIARYTLKNGEAFCVGKGENLWTTVHVADVGKVFIQLFQAALDGKENHLWNEDGIFLPESGKITFAEFAHLIVKAAKEQNLVQGENVKSLTAEEVDQYMPHGSVVLGTTVHTKSSRANKYLNWQPSEISLVEDIPEMVRREAEKL